MKRLLLAKSRATDGRGGDSGRGRACHGPASPPLSSNRTICSVRVVPHLGNVVTWLPWQSYTHELAGWIVSTFGGCVGDGWSVGVVVVVVGGQWWMLVGGGGDGGGQLHQQCAFEQHRLWWVTSAALCNERALVAVVRVAVSNGGNGDCRLAVRACAGAAASRS